MHKKDSSSIEKHQFKPFHKEKLRGRITSTERHIITQCWPMNASSSDYSAKDLYH